MSSCSSSRPTGKIPNTESCPSAKEIWKIFSVPFEPQALEDKIKECENSACCILKKIENLTTKKMKLVCAKQKCPFAIRLETIDGKYLLRDIQGEHNHSVSKEKFEEKLLTGRLLDYADLIYQTYFLTDSDFCSKPKLILKDLKNRHGIDLLAGNFSPSQRQKLKKKFDNIVQQLRLKKSRSDGSTNASCSPPLKKSVSAMTSNREPAQSLPVREYAISSASTLYGDSTNKKIKQTPFAFSNVPMKVAPGILDFAAIGQYQQQLQYQQAQMQFQQQQSQKQEIPTQFPLIHSFQLSLLKQQIQQQQELQISGGKQFINQEGLQVISEDSRSISQCKIEDQSEQSSEIQLAAQQELSISAPTNIAKANSCISMPSPAAKLSIMSQHSPLQLMNQLSPLGLGFGSIQHIGTGSNLQSIGVPPFENSCFLQQPEQQIQSNIQQQIQQILQQQFHNQLTQSLAQQQYQQQQQQLQQQQQIQQLYLNQNFPSPFQCASLFNNNNTNNNSNPTTNNISVFSLPSPIQLHQKSDSTGLSFPPQQQQQQLLNIPALQQLLFQSNQGNKSDSNNGTNNLSVPVQSLFQTQNQDSYNESCISSNQQPQTLLPSAA